MHNSITDCSPISIVPSTRGRLNSMVSPWTQHTATASPSMCGLSAAVWSSLSSSFSFHCLSAAISPFLCCFSAVNRVSPCCLVYCWRVTLFSRLLNFLHSRPTTKMSSENFIPFPSAGVYLGNPQGRAKACRKIFWGAVRIVSSTQF